MYRVAFSAYNAEDVLKEKMDTPSRVGNTAAI